MNAGEQIAYEAIKRRYSDKKWIVLPQVRISTGYKKLYGGDRVIDFYVMNMHPGDDYKCIAIEFKKSLSDLTKDLDDPLKHAAIKMYSDEFYYLLTERLYEKITGPNYNGKIFGKLYKYTSGIMFIGENGWISKHNILVKHQPKVPFSIGFICSLVRNAKNLQ